ncbi:MAG: hypothetical protein VX693_01665 [Pseudomonadota bacterium]|nr:hypothetical protein [Pseudomonadota bacterium]
MQRNKALVSIVITLGFIIIGGLAVLGYGLFKKANEPDFKFFKKSVQKPDKPLHSNTNFKKSISILLAKKERVHGIATSENKITIHITSENKQDRLLILNANNGALIGQIKFKYPK